MQSIQTKFQSFYLNDNYFHYLYFLDEKRITIFDLNQFNIIEEQNVNDFTPIYPILLDNYFFTR